MLKDESNKNNEISAKHIRDLEESLKKQIEKNDISLKTQMEENDKTLKLKIDENDKSSKKLVEALKVEIKTNQELALDEHKKCLVEEYEKSSKTNY